MSARDLQTTSSEMLLGEILGVLKSLHSVAVAPAACSLDLTSKLWDLLEALRAGEGRELEALEMAVELMSGATALLAEILPGDRYIGGSVYKLGAAIYCAQKAIAKRERLLEATAPAGEQEVSRG